MQYTLFAASKFALIALLTSTVNSSPILEDRDLFKRAPVAMGSAKSFGALAYTTLTSTGASALIGNGGVFPGTAITGWPPASCSGTLYAGGPVAQSGKAACQLAYNDCWAKASLAAALPSSVLGGGQVLPPGVYKFPTSAVTLSGTLTLNGTGNANGQFIFLVTTTFTSAAASKIVVINGAKPCNIYIVNGSSASIGSGSNMLGNLIAYTSISATNAATNNGTWCANNGAITLINNRLTALSGTCTSV